MRISRIEIVNFRNFRHLNVTVGQHAVIVGEHKIGKSNLLHALRLILDPSLPDSFRQLRQDDFWDGLPRPLSIQDRIEISVELADFEEDDNLLAILGEYLVVPEPMVARITYCFQPLTDLTAKPTKDADYEFSVYGGGRPERKVSYDLRKRLPLDLLPALRDAESDLANWRRSPLRPLLDQAAGGIDRKKLRELSEGITEATSAVAGCDEVREVAEQISTKLIEMVGSLHALEMVLGFSPTDGDRLIRSLRLFIDGGLRSVSEASLGSANLLYLALKSLEIERLIAEGGRSHTFLAIEEPEAHLHPHVQRRVYRTFLRPRQPIPQEVESENHTSVGSTILLTTHSPNIVSVTPVHSLLLLRRTSDGMATEAVSTAELSLDDTEIADIERYLDVSRGEVLFAKAVILVEGDAEEYLFPILAALNGYHLDELGISVCSVGGTHFLPYLKFLGPSGLDIPCVVITDMDPINENKTYGIPRVRRLLEHLVPDVIEDIADDNEIEIIANKQGIFLTAHTLEVALFRCGRRSTFARTMKELSTNRKAKSRAEKAKNDPELLDVAKMLKDIDAIGKGRFAQRWADHISRSQKKICPQSVLEACAYVADKVRPTPTALSDSSEGSEEES